MSTLSSHDVNGADSSSKLPDHAQSNPTSGTGGFQAQNRMTVEPPTKDDLQRSYARTVDAESSPKGWYGSMGMLLWLILSLFFDTIKVKSNNE